MNSYQKLKARNKELERYIELLIFKPDGAEAHHIKACYKLQRDAEIQVMFGGILEPDTFNSFSGITPHIKY